MPLFGDDIDLAVQLESLQPSAHELLLRCFERTDIQARTIESVAGRLDLEEAARERLAQGVDRHAARLRFLDSERKAILTALDVYADRSDKLVSRMSEAERDLDSAYTYLARCGRDLHELRDQVAEHLGVYEETLADVDQQLIDLRTQLAAQQETHNQQIGELCAIISRLMVRIAEVERQTSIHAGAINDLEGKEFDLSALARKVVDYINDQARYSSR